MKTPPFLTRRAAGTATKRNSAHLFSFGDPAAGNDDDLVFFVEGHDLSNAVGGAGMVHVARGPGKKKR